MPFGSLFSDYAGRLSEVGDHQALAEILDDACHEMGCRFFALTHHVDFAAAPGAGLRLHNYPEDWSIWFDDQKLGVSDPVHRASHLTARGFCWHEVPGMIRLSAADERVLEEARRHGIGDGFTIPANVPGEMLGSCTFATTAGVEMPVRWIGFAQWVGLFAFEAARRLDKSRPFEHAPALTERQSECAVWAGRGKTDWEIAQIIGVSRETIVDHMRNARTRYDTSSRTGIVVRALFDGSISFADIFKK